LDLAVVSHAPERRAEPFARQSLCKAARQEEKDDMEKHTPRHKTTAGSSAISHAGFPMRRLAIAAIVVALVGAFSVFAAVLGWKSEMHSARADFEKMARHMADDIQRELDTSVQVVKLLGSVFNKSDQISRGRFSAYANGAMAGRAGLQALEFIPRVSAQQRAGFEAGVRGEGFEKFSITQRTAGGELVAADLRPEHFPVLFVEPLAGNEPSLGFDLASQPERLEELSKARDSGEPVASGRVPLVQGNDRKNGLLIFHPVYLKDAPVGTSEEKHNNLLGFSLGVLRMDKMSDYCMEDVQAGGIKVWLEGKGVQQDEEPLFSSPFSRAPRDAGSLSLLPHQMFELKLPLSIGQRSWDLNFESSPGFLASRLTWRPWIALGAGLVITVLLGMYFFMTLRLYTVSDVSAAERARSELRLREKIHQIRLAEREARDKEEKLQILLAGIKAATLTVDAITFSILDLNPVAESLFSVSARDWIGKPHRELFGANMRPLDARTDMLQAVFNGTSTFASGEFLLELPDGRLVPISRTVLSASIMGKTYIFEVLFDISEKKALERQLGLAQKLESIGQLASGIAHEINTPIQYVSGNLGFLQDAFKSLADILARYDALAKTASIDPSLEEELQALDRAKEQARYDELLSEIPGSISDSIAGVERVAVIVGAMKKFSHPDVSEKRLLDVNKAIESTLTITRNEWKYTADMKTEFDPASPLLFCFPGDFNQVILNLVVNAAHAISDKYKGTGKKGLLTVSTSSDADSLTIRVSDTGTGIPPENTSRIFDPFFTTKEVGKGTGQGLAIVHSVVERHGGTIDLESTPGEGTTFILRFPLGQEHHV
jgi:signal transduction histidine kinase/sensor domain CHASE-containing protein